MEKFKIEFEDKSYDAVEINGVCVSDEDFHYDTIVLAECGLNEVLSECFFHNDNVSRYKNAIKVDEDIFGFAPKDLILNGSEKELEQYAHDLL